MPVNAAVVGHTTEAIVHEVDARWTMAYSAGLGDTASCYLDTTRDDGVVAHPLFSICPEWPVVLETRDFLLSEGLTRPESRRGVHATHDSHVHRLVRPGDRLYTRATIVTLEARSAGAFLITRLATTDEYGQPVATTYQGSLFRGVAVTGDGPLAPAAAVPPAPGRIPPGWRPVHALPIPVDTTAAHVYTECARIWNPIHTDLEVARAAGLPSLILHGSATLALAVSRIVEQTADGDPRRVQRVAGTFRGMVLMPSDLELRIYRAPAEEAQGAVRYEVLNPDGRPAIAEGLVALAPAET